MVICNYPDKDSKHMFVLGYLNVTVEKYAQGMFNISYLIVNEGELFNISVQGVVSRDNWLFGQAMGMCNYLV